VRQSRGLFGAEALSHAVPGVSRREAAAIKRATLTALERERKSTLSHVVVTEPGVIRGFDAMHVCTTEGPLYALCAGDGCVPFTTSIAVVARYDGPAVASALDQDFCEHGAPLVARMDRASCHRTDDVAVTCRDHQVLVLHGPPRHPRFYGQLERQNRDRRVWLQRAARPPPELLASELERNRVILNSEWRRRSLDWLTAEERWKRRQSLSIDRLELSDHVDDLTARFAAELESRVYDGLARRLAIEVALTQRGFLRREKREGC
jgi:transposase InsO family protein